MKERAAGNDEDRERRELEHDEEIVRTRRFAYADRQQRRENEHEDGRQDVALRMREIDAVEAPPAVEHHEIGGLRPRRQRDAEGADRVLHRGGKLLRDGRGADAVLEEQREADDPRREFAERRVRVRVRAAGDRDHRSEFRVTERGEERGDAGEQVRHEHGRAGAFDARADRREDTAADHRAEPDRYEILRGQRTAEFPFRGLAA